jgi:hypothetical protein
MTWLIFDRLSNERYVDAEAVPFAVIPQDDRVRGISFSRDTGVGKGDLALIMRGKTCSFGVVGDAGPYFRIGEASIRTHEDLGNPQCALENQKPCLKLRAHGSGIGIETGIVYILFPGTRPRPLLSQTVVQVARERTADAAARFFHRFRR